MLFNSPRVIALTAAEHVLLTESYRRETATHTDAQVRSLARAIQTTIETWVRDHAAQPTLQR